MKLTKSEIDTIACKIVRELKEAAEVKISDLVLELREKVAVDVKMVKELTKGISLKVNFSVESFPNDYPNYYFNNDSTDWAFKQMINKAIPCFDRIREDVVLSMIGEEFNIEDLIKTIKAKYEN